MFLNSGLLGGETVAWKIGCTALVGNMALVA